MFSGGEKRKEEEEEEGEGEEEREGAGGRERAHAKSSKMQPDCDQTMVNALCTDIFDTFYMLSMWNVNN